jgi:hypothetical protein
VTSAVLPRRAAPPRSLPLVFDGVAVFLAIQAHVLAAMTIARSLTAYRSLAVCIALVLVSLAVPLVTVVVARRQGGLSTPMFLAASAMLIFVDVALIAEIKSVDYGGAAVWTWGAIGVTVLTFAAYRSARDVLILAAAHCLVGVSAFGVEALRSRADAFELLLVISGCLLPALIAAGYLALYVRAIALRETAVQARLDTETAMIAQRAVREDSARRLTALRAETAPLLAQIADGILPINDTAVALRSRRLAQSLRAELVEARTGGWLLEMPRQQRSSEDDPTDDWPGTVVLDPEGILGHLTDADRTALAALLGMLRQHRAWQRISVVLTHTVVDQTTTGWEPVEVYAPMTVTIIAIGPPSADALGDPAVLAATTPLNATMTSDTDGVLVVETRLRADPRHAGLVPASVPEHTASGRPL